MRRAMDGLVVDRSARVVVGALEVLAAGCKPKFTGPYACETGYASCVNPSQNSCETDTTSDGLNCGACGKVCPVGAPCIDAGCGQGAKQVANLWAASQVALRTNSSTLFWSSSNVVYSLALTAPAGTLPTELVNDEMACGSGGTPFAVDDTNLYYLSSGSSGCTGSGSCQGLTQVSLTGGVRTLLVSASGGLAGNLASCGALAVN